MTNRLIYEGEVVKCSKQLEQSLVDGGQIVGTIETVRAIDENVRGKLGAHYVRDLGQHKIKDIGKPRNLVQIMPEEFKERTLSPLNTESCLSRPFDAAPGMTKGSEVSLMFLSVTGKQGAEGEEDAGASKAHTNTIRGVVQKCNAYECKEDKGTFMLSFDKTSECMTFIDQAVKEFKAGCAALGLGPDDNRIFMGVNVGVPSAIRAHPSTGRADYFGPFVNKTARIAALATQSDKQIAGQGGDASVVCLPGHSVLISKEFHDKLGGPAAQLDPGVEIKHVGTFTLKGQKEPADVCRVTVG